MSEDWSAVAKAINERAHEVGMTQRELSETSRVSLAIVRELQRNTVQRRRSTRTLEALSLALGWHPRHLSAVLYGHQPPAPGDPVELRVGDGVPERLAAIEDRLTELTEQLAEINANITTVISRDTQDSP
ncbi:helix-turn-helix domain-containing protein [Actinokineospora sp.]|uniref:helix-turn-helix domain-containing protein n=1 Tax=Actinokineospora sp. TaxID=1872133 RepID=UPI004037D7D2